MCPGRWQLPSSAFAPIRRASVAVASCFRTARASQGRAGKPERDPSQAAGRGRHRCICLDDITDGAPCVARGDLPASPTDHARCECMVWHRQLARQHCISAAAVRLTKHVWHGGLAQGTEVDGRWQAGRAQPSPKGFPMANTRCPTSRSPELPTAIGCSISCISTPLEKRDP